MKNWLKIAERAYWTNIAAAIVVVVCWLLDKYITDGFVAVSWVFLAVQIIAVGSGWWAAFMARQTFREGEKAK